MESNWPANIQYVCSILNKHSVEYLIVGGTAVALYGYFRLSHTSSGEIAAKNDIDIWYNPVYQNYFNLLNALESLGQDVSELKKEKTPTPRNSFFRLNEDSFTLDFLPVLPGLPKFRAAFENRAHSKIGEVEFNIISFNDLILNKETQARPKDLEDIRQLTLRRPNSQQDNT